jgi:phosphatidylserine synthase
MAESRPSPPRLFGIKDLFTTINLLGGAVGILLCLHDRPFAAGISVLLGYMLGDSIDGWVARKLNTANRFGAEYDVIADHLAQGIAPGVIVYTVYRGADLGLSSTATEAVAVALGCAVIIAASVRHARNTVQPVDFPSAWVGLPRSAGGLLAIAYVDASLAPFAFGGMWLGVFLIPVICWASLSHQPFVKHRLPRRHLLAARIFIALFFLTNFAVLAWRPAFIFDLVFFWFSGYALSSWMALTREERAEFRAAVVRARQSA